AVPQTAAAIIKAFTTDLVWKRAEAELDIAATRWRNRKEDGSYLLRGRRLDAAERHIEARPNDPLRSTELVIEFVRDSRRATVNAERRRADAVRIAIATEVLSRDATTAALLLLEIEDPDGTPFAISPMNEVLRRWLIRREFRPHAAPTTIAISADGSHLASVSVDGTGKVWRADGEGHIVSLPIDGQGDVVSFSRDGTRVVTAANDGKVRVWATDGSRPSIVFVRHYGRPEFSPTGDRIAILTEDGRALIHKLDGSDPI